MKRPRLSITTISFLNFSRPAQFFSQNDSQIMITISLHKASSTCPLIRLRSRLALQISVFLMEKVIDRHLQIIMVATVLQHPWHHNKINNKVRTEISLIMKVMPAVVQDLLSRRRRPRMSHKRPLNLWGTSATSLISNLTPHFSNGSKRLSLTNALRMSCNWGNIWKSVTNSQ